jgi:hypothetical protein
LTDADTDAETGTEFIDRLKKKGFELGRTLDAHQEMIGPGGKFLVPVVDYKFLDERERAKLAEMVDRAGREKPPARPKGEEHLADAGDAVRDRGGKAKRSDRPATPPPRQGRSSGRAAPSP